MPAGNPNPGGPVAIPPDTTARPQPQPPPQPTPQPRPAPDRWDSFWNIERVTDDDDWTRHFRIGAMVALNIKASFNVNSAIAFSGSQVAQGIYDDGYVHPSPNGSYTADWGYNNASQYDATLHRLYMHETTSFSAGGGGSLSADSGDSEFLGFDMAYGGNIWNWGRTRIGWELGFGLLPVSIKSTLTASGQVNRNIYAFDTTGADDGFPLPGYQGSAENPWSIQSAGTLPPDTTPATLTGSYKLDMMLYTVRLGPSLYWDLSRHLGLSAGAGPAVGIASGSMKYTERISVSSQANTGQMDATDVVYGGYANATLMYHIPGENGDLYVGAQYMSLGDAIISGGGREGRLKLGGQVYITAGINWPF
jgi:hypothetical protein